MMLALRSWFSNRSSSLQNIGFLLIIILLVVSIASSRIYKLDSVPAGLFFDESSIGYNAITILRLGQDEHGVRYPIYFKSVGDYKNPLYIYAVAIIFSMFGASEFTLRLTSVIFFGVALFFWGIVGCQDVRRKENRHCFWVACLWFFTAFLCSFKGFFRDRKSASCCLRVEPFDLGDV